MSFILFKLFLLSNHKILKYVDLMDIMKKFAYFFNFVLKKRLIFEDTMNYTFFFLISIP